MLSCLQIFVSIAVAVTQAAVNKPLAPNPPQCRAYNTKVAEYIRHNHEHVHTTLSAIQYKSHHRSALLLGHHCTGNITALETARSFGTAAKCCTTSRKAHRTCCFAGATSSPAFGKLLVLQGARIQCCCNCSAALLAYLNYVTA